MPEFNGLLVKFDFHKNISGVTIINKNIDCFCDAELNRRLQNVKLEACEFSDHFKIETTDQVEARYILTPAVMENIYKLSQYEKNI